MAMASNEIRLTRALGEQIAGAIRAGGYPHVAAEAFGVPKEIFDDWLKRGNEKDPWEPYKSFALAIREAFAQARLRAETAEFEKDPKLWLIHGPGRERERQPGWSVSVQPAAPNDEARNALCDPEVMQVFKKVLAALEPFPDARQQVVQALMIEAKAEDKETEHGTASV
jgi:hypothetical protein